MALQTLLFQQDPFVYNSNDLYNLFGGNSDFGQLENEEEKSSFHFRENQTENFHHQNLNSEIPSLLPNLEEWVPNSALDSIITNVVDPEGFPQFDNFDSSKTEPGKQNRRRRSRSKRRIEDIENQRMTHIAVERNRRRQMNDYLSALRQLMPESYVQRGDQASIVSGAINYVKELEQQLQFLIGQNHFNQQKKESTTTTTTTNMPFDEFFTFPQYSSYSPNPTANINSSSSSDDIIIDIGDIEVRMVERHASIKIRSKRKTKQLLRLLSGLQSLCLTLLHLNVTTVDQVVIYSVCLKVEDECKLTSVDEIATAIYHLLRRIHEEAILI